MANNDGNASEICYARFFSKLWWDEILKIAGLTLFSHSRCRSISINGVYASNLDLCLVKIMPPQNLMLDANVLRELQMWNLLGV